MSLRDQLLKAGLISKKQAKAADQADRKAKKQDHGNQDRKRDREQAQAAARAEEQARVQAQRLAERKEREAVRSAHERALQIRQIIAAHRIRGGGPLAFHHRDATGRFLVRASVSAGIAKMLRCGDVAIVALDRGNRVDYELVGRRAAERLETLAPAVIVWWAREPRGLSEPDQQLSPRDWAPDLRAHRASGGPA